jgi:hypothetical protein
MTKRKTYLDKAIDTIDQQIAEHRAAIKALELARAHLVDQHTAARPPTLKSVAK